MQRQKATTGLVVRAVGAVLSLTWLVAVGLNAADGLDGRLAAVLRGAGFTGRVESTLEVRLGRPVDLRLANLGRLLFFDKITALHADNACAGCHSPTAAFGDTQSIAIGVQNNNIVGPNRRGPRNQRRTPTVINAAFFPALMWNGRFFAPSGDPFDNSQGFVFPPPEGTGAFPAGDPVITNLLTAQAHLPPTELVESAGFTGTAGGIGPRFDQFDDGLGDVVPSPDASGFRNEPIRQAVLRRLNESRAYRILFAALFPDVAAGAPIDFSMFARAIGEFELTLVFANAPIDRFARGERSAMTPQEKDGALLFFGDAGCVQCHAVEGTSNEMFSDFAMHVVGVPQIAPWFGIGSGNVVFDGPGEDEDFGLEQVTGNAADRYKFRTSPLRNVALQSAFFHNGSFTRLEDAIRHHVDTFASARSYSAIAAATETWRSPSDRSSRSSTASIRFSRIRGSSAGGSSRPWSRSSEMGYSIRGRGVSISVCRSRCRCRARCPHSSSRSARRDRGNVSDAWYHASDHFAHRTRIR